MDLLRRGRGTAAAAARASETESRRFRALSSGPVLSLSAPHTPTRVSASSSSFAADYTRTHTHTSRPEAKRHRDPSLSSKKKSSSPPNGDHAAGSRSEVRLRVRRQDRDWARAQSLGHVCGAAGIACACWERAGRALSLPPHLPLSLQNSIARHRPLTPSFRPRSMPARPICPSIVTPQLDPRARGRAPGRVAPGVCASRPARRSRVRCPGHHKNSPHRHPRQPVSLFISSTFSMAPIRRARARGEARRGANPRDERLFPPPPPPPTTLLAHSQPNPSPKTTKTASPWPRPTLPRSS